MSQDLRITTAKGETVKLDEAGKGSIDFQVRNDSATQLRIFARLFPIDLKASTAPAPGGNAPDQSPLPAKPSWMKIVGDDKKYLPLPGEVTFTVELNVPLPKPPGRKTTSPAPAMTQPAADPGEYRFYFRAESVDEPDAHWGRGPDISFTIPKTKKSVCIPCIVIPIAAVLLIGIGLGIYFLMASSGSVAVPDLTTPPMQLADAKSLLEKNGLKMGVPTSKPTADKEVGIVVSQDPAAGTKVEKGKEIEVTVASAPKQVMVDLPNVKGISSADADTALSKGQLVASFDPPKFTSNPPTPGTVLEETPDPANTKQVAVGTRVHLVPEAAWVAAPSYKTLAEANANQSKFPVHVPVQKQFTPGNPPPPGTIISQTPAGGTPVMPDTPISVVVEDDWFRMPALMGRPNADVMKTIRSLGFKKIPIVTGNGPVVMGQFPAPGAAVTLDQQISIQCIPIP